MKMPVGETLEGAFSFAFRNFLSVIGTMWFPYLLAGAIIGGVVYLLHPDVNAMFAAIPVDNKDPMAVFRVYQKYGHIITLAWVVLLIAGAMVRVGLMRKALGLHPGLVFIYFSLGAPVWRMIGASLLLSIIMVAIVLADIAGCALVIGLAGHALQQPVLWIADAIAVVIAIVIPVYAAFRFFFFLTPVIVAEERIGIGRAWSLGGGNVLRIIVVLLAILLAVAIVFGILESFFLPHFVMTGTTVDPQDVQRWQAKAITSPAFVVLLLLQVVVTEALMAGAMATGYRAVTGTAEGSAS
ncbi:MAG: hypothetical protein ACREHE_07380 [Rhizomicrobium sp.]